MCAHMFLLLLNELLGVKLWGYIVKYVKLLETVKSFLKIIIKYSTFTSYSWEFIHFTSLPTLNIVKLLTCNLSKECVLVPHCTLICIFRTSYIKHFFMCLFTFHISSFVKSLFNFFLLLLLKYQHSSYFLYINILLYICIGNIFFQPVACFFIKYPSKKHVLNFDEIYNLSFSLYYFFLFFMISDLF